MEQTVTESAREAWYVVQTKPHKEKMVLGLFHQAGLQAFTPMLRRALRSRPMFPRYCFIKADLDDAHRFHMVRYTRGAIGVLGDATGPVSVSPSFIEHLQLGMRDGAFSEQELLFRAGDKVRVTSGVLQDLVGIVQKNLSEQGRVRILFKWLARKLVADVDYSQTEKAA